MLNLMILTETFDKIKRQHTALQYQIVEWLARSAELAQKCISLVQGRKFEDQLPALFGSDLPSLHVKEVGSAYCKAFAISTSVAVGMATSICMG